MLVPSTITARRTRRYTSTLYIRHTAHRLDFKPMDGGRWGNFQLPHVSNLPARAVHFTSAVHSRADPSDYNRLETGLPVAAL